jgi:cytochrome c-type biogenesis protein
MEAFLTSFTLGLLATTSPCVFPLYPGFLAYLSGGQEKLAASRGRYFLGFFVLLGVLVMMLALGGLIALLSISVGQALSVIVPLADAVIILLGVLLIFNINPFKRLPQIQVPGFSNPYANAFIYGLLYGPITLPCSGPLVVSIFALSLSAGEALSRTLVFLWFGLGFGVPLLALSFLAGAVQRKLTRFMAVHSRKVNLAGGLLLVAVGIWDLYVNWPAISLLLGF